MIYASRSEAMMRRAGQYHDFGKILVIYKKNDRITSTSL
jgi:hypothetical protein